MEEVVHNDSDGSSRSLDELGGVSRGCSEGYGHKGERAQSLVLWQKTTRRIRTRCEMVLEQQSRSTLRAAFYLGCFYLQRKPAGHKPVALQH